VTQDDQRSEERMELHHEAVPGYRTVFTVVFAVLTIYLAAVMMFTTGGAH
jgi:hypothetical protein